MTRTTETRKLTMTGDTKPSREQLKARGWRWNAERGYWWMTLVDAHADRILAGDVEFLRGLNGTRKGCQVSLDGVVVWTSKTYGVAMDAAEAARDASDERYWDCDAAGNNVAGPRIPGSLDRI